MLENLGGSGQQDYKLPDMQKMPQGRLSFVIKSTYDTLPSPSNINLCYGSDENRQLCNAPKPSLQHILSRYKTTLAQGQYRWRQDKILRKLAEVLEADRLKAAKDHPSTMQQLIHFVGQGGGAQSIARGNLNRQLMFPTVITTTSL